MNRETKQYIKFMYENHPGRLFVASVMAIPLLVLAWQIFGSIWVTPSGTDSLGWTVFLMLMLLSIILLVALVFSGLQFIYKLLEED